jgi:hypothetical protein
MLLEFKMHKCHLVNISLKDRYCQVYEYLKF